MLTFKGKEGVFLIPVRWILPVYYFFFFPKQQLVTNLSYLYLDYPRAISTPFL